MFEARRISRLSGITPNSGMDKISSTSSMLSISPEFERAGSNRVRSRCFSICSPRSARRVFESRRPMIRSEFSHRGHFRVRDHDRLVRMPHRQKRASLDACRAVAKHVVESLAQLADHPLDALGGQRVLVARLRGREQVQSVDALIADQRLRKLGVPLRDVDEVKDEVAARHPSPDRGCEVRHRNRRRKRVVRPARARRQATRSRWFCLHHPFLM